MTLRLAVSMIDVLELIRVDETYGKHTRTRVRVGSAIDDLMEKCLAGQCAGQRVELKISRISDFGQVAR